MKKILRCVTPRRLLRCRHARIWDDFYPVPGEFLELVGFAPKTRLWAFALRDYAIQSNHTNENGDGVLIWKSFQFYCYLYRLNLYIDMFG